jgi:ribonuclease HIII
MIFLASTMDSNRDKGKSPRKQPSCQTLELTEFQADKLRIICEARGWELYSLPYARYAFRGDGINIAMYNSGKLVVQGKGMVDFITFTLEPQITQTFTFGNEEIFHDEWFLPHAGLDESGKGDFFGPVVTACVIAGRDEVRTLRDIGVKDSKAVTSDRAILGLEIEIRKVSSLVIEVTALSMPKYNELYRRFGENLNRLLGWMHACSLKNALKRRYVADGLLDQFSKRPIVQGFMKRDFPDFDLRMRTKAESDPVVATASIIARAEYLHRLEWLSEEANVELPKGAGRAVIEVGQKIFEDTGSGGLARYSKTHFKTFNKICGIAVDEAADENEDEDNPRVDLVDLLGM